VLGSAAIGCGAVVARTVDLLNFRSPVASGTRGGLVLVQRACPTLAIQSCINHKGERASLKHFIQECEGTMLSAAHSISADGLSAPDPPKGRGWEPTNLDASAPAIQSSKNVEFEMEISGSQRIFAQSLTVCGSISSPDYRQ